LCYNLYTLVFTILKGEITMEQMPRVRTEAFTEQFTVVLYEHWIEIIDVLNRQSPRLAALLRGSRPVGMKRTYGGWLIMIMTRRVEQPDKLRQPRDNEVVAHAIRSWARAVASLSLPQITVQFE
jgi:hypothetical protein